MTAENPKSLLFLESPNLDKTFRDLAVDLNAKGIATHFTDNLDSTSTWIIENKHNPNSTWVIDWEALPVGGVDLLRRAKQEGFAGRVLILTLNAKAEFLGDCKELGCEVELKPLQDLDVLESSRGELNINHE